MTSKSKFAFRVGSSTASTVLSVRLPPTQLTLQLFLEGRGSGKLFRKENPKFVKWERNVKTENGLNVSGLDALGPWKSG